MLYYLYRQNAKKVKITKENFDSLCPLPFLVDFFIKLCYAYPSLPRPFPGAKGGASP